jgi:hypothetical protein
MTVGSVPSSLSHHIKCIDEVLLPTHVDSRTSEWELVGAVQEADVVGMSGAAKLRDLHHFLQRCLTAASGNDLGVNGIPLGGVLARRLDFWGPPWLQVLGEVHRFVW